jgi:hypothetical protein
VLSPFALSSTIATNGIFTTRVSASIVHPIYIVDAQQAVWSLGLSVPGQPLLANAEGCLLGLLFFLPGIYTPEPAQAQATIAALRAQAGYGDLLALLQTSLRANPLQMVCTNPDFLNAQETFLTAFYASNAVAPNVLVGGSAGGVTVVPTGAGTRDPRIVILNDTFRHVAINRVDKDGAGAVIQGNVAVTGALSTFNLLPYLSGAGRADIPELFDATQISSIQDQSPADFNQVATSEYWFQAPGFGNPETLPGTIPADPLGPTLLTLLNYGIWPTLQATLPFVSLPGGLFVRVARVCVANMQDLNSDLSAVVDSTHADRAASVFSFMATALGLITANASDLFDGILTSQQQSTLPTLFGAYRGLSQAVTFSRAIHAITTQPPTFHIFVTHGN